MEVYRLARAKYANTLSGVGAAIKGARWNSKGVEVIYTASNRSLAMAEVAVHLSIANLPTDYMMTTIYVPNTILIDKVNQKKLPKDWNCFPPVHTTQIIGDTFVYTNKFALLQVPSAVTKGDFNFILNPHHIDFKKIKIIKTDRFPFDKRLFF